MENNLPDGWTSCPLKDVLSSRKGKKPATVISHEKKGYDPYLLIDELEGKPARSFTNDPRVPRSNKKDVLLVWDGSIGKCASGISGAVGSTIAVLSPKNGLKTKFLEYFIRRNKNYILETSTGTGLQHINKSFLKTTEIPLPPNEEEQERIADKLDSLLEKVKDAQSRLDKIPVILGRFRQSVLLNACSGKLTKNWRKANKQNEEWDIAKLIDLGEVTGGITKNTKRKTLKMQVPYLRVANVYENRLELNQILKIGVTEKEFERTVLSKGDILFVEGNGSIEQIGRVALWDGSIDRCVHQNHLIKFRTGSKVDPVYVLLQMMAPNGRAQLIEKAVSTAGLHSLSISKISEVECPVPSIAEQKEIIRRVKTLFNFIDQVKSRYSTGKAYADKLEQSILAKAFRGELVR